MVNNNGLHRSEAATSSSIMCNQKNRNRQKKIGYVSGLFYELHPPKDSESHVLTNKQKTVAFL